eukprot:TRINITY_DN6229_c0_g1_i2.p1 TRINITY_DN6229_c0_g1~~TRINITY_DN6229_c0_g1_i2.p1  ORF type:complete len:317 (-),score=53.49 TRINITY_DN6229_c0_g1_i2:33-923(-)
MCIRDRSLVYIEFHETMRQKKNSSNITMVIARYQNDKTHQLEFVSTFEQSSRTQFYEETLPAGRYLVLVDANWKSDNRYLTMAVYSRKKVELQISYENEAEITQKKIAILKDGFRSGKVAEEYFYFDHEKKISRQVTIRHGMCMLYYKNETKHSTLHESNSQIHKKNMRLLNPNISNDHLIIELKPKSDELIVFRLITDSKEENIFLLLSHSTHFIQVNGLRPEAMGVNSAENQKKQFVTYREKTYQQLVLTESVMCDKVILKYQNQSKDLQLREVLSFIRPVSYTHLTLPTIYSV